jgi:signal transduction histidine kinase
MIYRISQEQLNNIIKHSEATLINIALDKLDGILQLSIKDNGKGCDLSAERNGVGIQNIMTRAALHDGKVNIESSPGNGFELTINFPLLW